MSCKDLSVERNELNVSWEKGRFQALKKQSDIDA